MAAAVGKSSARDEVAIAQGVMDAQLAKRQNSFQIISFEEDPQASSVEDLVAKVGPVKTLAFLELEERTRCARLATDAAYKRTQEPSAYQQIASVLTINIATAMFGVKRCVEFADEMALALRQAGVESDVAIFHAQNPAKKAHNHAFAVFGEGIQPIIRQRDTDELSAVLATLTTGWVCDAFLATRVIAAREFSSSPEYAFMTLYGITEIIGVNHVSKTPEFIDFLAKESQRIHAVACTLLPAIRESRRSTSALEKYGPSLTACILQTCIPGTTWTHPKLSCQVPVTTAWSIAQYLKAYGLTVKLPKVLKPGANSLEIDKPDYAKVAELKPYEEYQSAARRMIVEVTAPHVEAGRALLIAEYF